MNPAFPSNVTEPKTRVCNKCRRQRSIGQFHKLNTPSPGNAQFPARDRTCNACKKAPPDVQGARSRPKEFHEYTPQEIREIFRIKQ